MDSLRSGDEKQIIRLLKLFTIQYPFIAIIEHTYQKIFNKKKLGTLTKDSNPLKSHELNKT